ncbi:MAG: class I SAM-dependent methyltransferase [bacterium]
MANNIPDYLNTKFDYGPEFVATYDEVPLWSAAFGMLLFAHLPIKPNMKVVDIGCGTGFPTLELAQRLGDTCYVYGVDPWAPAIARGREKQKNFRITNVEFIESDAAQTKLPESSIDLIISNLGLNNFENKIAVLSECYRILKPCGKLVLTTNLQGHWHEFYTLFKSTLVELGKSDLVDTLDTHIRHRTSLATLIPFLQTYGFNIVCIHEDKFKMRFLTGSAFLRHSFIRCGFLENWMKVIPERELTPVFLKLEQNLNQLAIQHGELRLTVPMAYIESEKKDTQ